MAGIQRLWSAIRRALGSATLWGASITAVRSLGFLVVLGYALRRLPRETIGLWYVMQNLAGLAGAVEFGFSSTLGRYASYYLAGAEAVPRLGLPPVVSPISSPNLEALAGLIRMARRLFARLGLGSSAFLLGAWVVWCHTAGQQPPPGSRATTDFVLLAIGFGYGMSQFFWMGLLYGLNRVGTHARLMVAGLLANYTVALVGLRLGAGLTALVAGYLVFHLLPRLVARRLVLRGIPSRDSSDRSPVAAGHLWPVTWRTGMAQLTSYVTMQCTTLFCSFFADLGATGSYGLTLQLGLTLHLLSATWLWARQPEISALRASGQARRAVRVVRSRALLTIATYIAGALAVVVIAPGLLEGIGSRTPLLPRAQMIGLLTMVGLDLVVGVHASVLQTGNEVPHLGAFIVTAALSAALAWPLGRALGVWGIILAPVAAQAPLNYWWTPSLCWRRLRAEMHQEVTRFSSSET